MEYNIPVSAVDVDESGNSMDPTNDTVGVEAMRIKRPTGNNDLVTIKHYLTFPRSLLNVLYNTRMYILIIWNVYFIADWVSVAGNTRTAEERNLASPGTDMADLECMDRNTATSDFYLFGVPAIVLVLFFMGVLIANLAHTVWFEKYGTIGYITQFMASRRTIIHRSCCPCTAVVVLILIIYGSVQSVLQEAPLFRTASPLLLGLYSTTVVSWELYDDTTHCIVCTSSAAKAVEFNYRVLSDIRHSVENLHLGLEQALFARDCSLLLSMGISRESCEVLISGGLSITKISSEKQSVFLSS